MHRPSLPRQLRPLNQPLNHFLRRLVRKRPPCCHKPASIHHVINISSNNSNMPALSLTHPLGSLRRRFQPRPTLSLKSSPPCFQGNLLLETTAASAPTGVAAAMVVAVGLPHPVPNSRQSRRTRLRFRRRHMLRGTSHRLQRRPAPPRPAPVHHQRSPGLTGHRQRLRHRRRFPTNGCAPGRYLPWLTSPTSLKRP